MDDVPPSAAGEAQIYASSSVSASLDEGKKLGWRSITPARPEVTIERRSSNRALMPTVASIVDEYRARFPDLKVIYASENGVAVGLRAVTENTFTIPRNYRRPAGGWPK